MLHEVVEYVNEHATSGILSLFGHYGPLYFGRIVAGFLKGLCKSPRLSRQHEGLLKAVLFFLASFLQFGEHVLLQTFFESGVVVAVMVVFQFHTSEEERVYAALLSELISRHGLEYKRKMYDAGIVKRCIDTMSDAVNCDTLKACSKVLWYF